MTLAEMQLFLFEGGCSVLLDWHSSYRGWIRVGEPAHSHLYCVLGRAGVMCLMGVIARDGSAGL